MHRPWKAPDAVGTRGEQPATPSRRSLGQPLRHRPQQQHHRYTSRNTDTSRKRHRIWSVTWSRSIVSMSRKDGEAIHTLSAGSGSEIPVELPVAVEVNIGCAPALSPRLSRHRPHRHSTALAIRNTTINYWIWVVTKPSGGYHTITITSPGGDHATTHLEVKKETIYYDLEALKPY